MTYETQYPVGMRARRPAMKPHERDALLRLSQAYRDTFILPNGEHTPQGAIVLRDLARFTQMYTGTIPRTAIEGTVLATLHSVYSHIMQMLNTNADDIPVIVKDDEDAR